MKIKQTARIAQLNDLCRTAMGIAGRLVQTAGVSALAPALQSAIRERVETFDAFTPDNDTYGEHDFGAFDVDDLKIFWKIDYYNRDLSRGSEDPSDPQQTGRVLTIMLASDYWLRPMRPSSPEGRNRFPGSKWRVARACLTPAAAAPVLVGSCDRTTGA
jgi:hypothetical protein